MTAIILPSVPLPLTLPDHTKLPFENGTFVKNFQEHPQSILITDSLEPILQKLHPSGDYAIGQDSGIYWRLTEPPERGAEAPDWFYVPNVPPSLNGQLRRSYVMWQEIVAPFLVLEFVSGDGTEERDRTPYKGKFWVYEQAIRVPFYGIYEVNKAQIEVFYLTEGSYQVLPTNERGHYPILGLGVEAGIWQGRYQNIELPWLRFWDAEGNLLRTGHEQAQQTATELQQESQARQQAEARADEESQARRQAEVRANQESQARQQAQIQVAQLAQKLRELGIEPDLMP